MKINLTRLSTKALGGLEQDVIKASTSGRYTVVADHPLLLKLIDEGKTYDRLYSKLTFSGMGEVVLAADQKRDTQFSNTKLFLDGYRRFPQLPHAADAEALYKLFDRYGDGLTKLAYVEESAQLRKLFTDLDTPVYTEHIRNLGIESIVRDLKQYQTDFETLYSQQAEANADLRLMPSATAARKNLEVALKAYLGLLESMKTVSGWENLYAEINEYVKAAG